MTEWYWAVIPEARGPTGRYQLRQSDAKVSISVGIDAHLGSCRQWADVDNLESYLDHSTQEINLVRRSVRIHSGVQKE